MIRCSAETIQQCLLRAYELKFTFQEGCFMKRKDKVVVLLIRDLEHSKTQVFAHRCSNLVNPVKMT